MPNEHPHHQYILQQYLVKPCPGPCSTPTLCGFYHDVKNKRRTPYSSTGQLAYSASLCQLAAKGEECLLGDTCTEAHALTEVLFHPTKYKTSWCENSNCSGPAYCSKAHRGVEVLRLSSQATTFGAKTTKHLDLSKFKTQACPSQSTHNPKLCEFFHSSKDRRRKVEYSVELCRCEDPDACPQGEACAFAHNIVEQLYHSEKYKTKFCSFYPNRLSECDYGNYCSFAHSEQDIKVELLHTYPRNYEFYTSHFKTVWCPFTTQHDKGLCVYAHNWQDFRRKPEERPYEPLLCSQWKTSTFISTYEEGGCENMMNCRRCHGWKEIEYHPATYKTRQCPLGQNCSKSQDCPMLHSAIEQRNPLGDTNNRYYTPHPNKLMLSPDPEIKLESFTPFVANYDSNNNFQTRNRVEEVKKVNATTSGFALHRGVKKGLNVNAKPFTSVIAPDLDQRVLTFLTKHKLLSLSSFFVGLKYEDIPQQSLPKGVGRQVQAAWEDEQEEMEDADDLIMNDIAIFTGQKESPVQNLKRYSFKVEDASHLTVTFENPSSIPASLKCPLTKKLMRNPCVFTLDGKTYERSAIVKFINENYPKGDAQNLVTALKPNGSIRQEILKRFE